MKLINPNQYLVETLKESAVPTSLVNTPEGNITVKAPDCTTILNYSLEPMLSVEKTKIRYRLTLEEKVYENLTKHAVKNIIRITIQNLFLV